MRFYTRFFVALITLTLSLHYYCSVSECSAELQQVCRYTSPVVWDEFLVEKNEFYKDHMHPVVELVQREYAVRLQPQIVKLRDDVHDNAYIPVANFVSQRYESTLQWVVESVGQLRRKVSFYYNVFVKPRIQRIVYYCKLDEFCAAAHSKLGPFLEKIRFIWHYLRPYTEKARSSVAEGYADLRNKYFGTSHWITGGKFEDKTTDEESLESSESESEPETDDEEEEELETSTITSTVLVTVTMEDNAVASQTEEAALEVSEQEALQSEFDIWYQLIDQKSSNLIRMFDRDVEKTAKKIISEVEPVVKEKTNHRNIVALEHFKKLNKAIQDINCTSEIDPESGEVIYFDRTGTTQLSNYITRPLMRVFFKDAHSELDSLTKNIENDLQILADNIKSEVSKLREDILEVYEEWGDVMVSEWSKRLAYVDVVAVHLDENDEDQLDLSSKNWERFLQLKKQVIKARDDLVSHPAHIKALKEFLDKAHWIAETVTKDSGEYLYILRARANLAFQEREKLELEKSAQELATSSPSNVANETVPEHSPDHVENQVHAPVEEAVPVPEDLQQDSSD